VPEKSFPTPRPRASLGRTVFGGFVGVSATIYYTVAGWLLIRLTGRVENGLEMTRRWARSCLWATGCPIHVEGLEDVEPDRTYVVMANHQSALDIPALLAALPIGLRLTIWAKRPLFSIPFLGWAMRAQGFIPIDREDRSGAAAMIGASRAQLEIGRSALVFPEQTYAPPERMLPFQRGGFVMALRAGRAILPVGVVGTADALPQHARLIRPTALRVRFGPAIEVAGLSISAREDLERQTAKALSRLSGKPIAEEPSEQ